MKVPSSRLKLSTASRSSSWLATIRIDCTAVIVFCVRFAASMTASCAWTSLPSPRLISNARQITAFRTAEILLKLCRGVRIAMGA